MPTASTRCVTSSTWAERAHVLAVTADATPFRPPADGVEHFFKEHRWGFGHARNGSLVRYEVEHAVWDIFPIRSYRLELDWAAVYGPEWALLGEASPYSTVLAAGSPVRVFPNVG